MPSTRQSDLSAELVTDVLGLDDRIGSQDEGNEKTAADASGSLGAFHMPLSYGCLR